MRSTSSYAALSLLFLALAYEHPAFADAGTPSTASSAAAADARIDKLSLWQDKWPEFSTTEAILTVTAALGTGAIVLVGPARHPRWEGGILFDGAVRNEFRARNPETRSHFRTVGNYTYHLSPLIPVVDVLPVSTLGHADGKLALNLGLITLEAYSYTGLAAFVSTEISARAPRQRMHQPRLYGGHAIVF